MAYDSNWGRPVNTAVRPVNKGIFQDRPSNLVEPGAFWDIENFHVRDYELQRRGGFTPFIEGEDIPEPIIDVFTVNNKGTKETLVLTEERLFKILEGGLEEQTIDITDASVSWAISAQGRIEATVTSAVLDYLRAGLPVYEGSNYVGDIIAIVGLVITITNPSGATSVVGWGDFNSYNRWLGYLGFHASHCYLPGTYDKVIITAYDGSGLYEYDPTTGIDTFDLIGLDTSPTDIQKAKAVTHFADRLWLGNVTVGGLNYPRRVYWSELGEYEVFDPLSFVDLPDSDGDLITMKSMGNLLILYFTDSIYLGRPTQLFGLPYSFEKFEASDLGLQSNRGVVSWLDGHFLVLNDDIYYFSNSLALQPIGSQVKKLTVKASTDAGFMHDVQITPDVANNDIVFMFPTGSNASDSEHGGSSVIWRYHYSTQAWTKDKVAVDAGGLPRYYFSGIYTSYFYNVDKSWEDWWEESGNQYSPQDLTDAGLPYPTDGSVAWDGGDNQNWIDYRYWFDLSKDAFSNKNLYIGISQTTNQGLYVEGTDGFDLIQAVEYPIVELVEGSDVDFNAPDTDKTVTRCSVKLLDPVDDAFSLNFHTSNNRGRSWRTGQYWRIKTDEDEGRVDFLSTGSNFRFRLVGDSLTSRDPYSIMEYVIRTAGRGLQTDDI